MGMEKHRKKAETMMMLPGETGRTRMSNWEKMKSLLVMTRRSTVMSAERQLTLFN
jgi:hypothetical protein